MVTCIIVFSKKRQIPCQELFEFFYKKTPAANLITANRPEGEDCGEWLRTRRFAPSDPHRSESVIQVRRN